MNFRLILVTIVLFVSQAAQAMSDGLPDFPFMLITGTATKEIAPNTAEIHFDLLDFQKSAELASANVGKKSTEVLELCKKHGVSTDKISSTNFNKTTTRKRGENYSEEQEILGYEVSQSFTINMSDLTKFPELMDKLASLQNLNQLNVTFENSNQDSIEKELVADAIKNAKEKANFLVKNISAKKATIFAISQDQSLTTRFRTFGYYGSRAPNLAPPDFVPPPDFTITSLKFIAPKTITFSKSVDLIYKLEP